MPGLAAMLAFSPVTAWGVEIVVDTGHSASSHGATAQDGTREHSLNRSVAIALIQELRGRGHQVRDVEGEGYNRSLMSRVLDTADAQLFISIHHDSVQQHYLDAGLEREFRGYSVFVSGHAHQLDGCLRCAISIGDAMRSAGQQPSLYHAWQVPGENRPLLDATRGIHRYDGLAVLKHARSPAILLEMGVMVNPDELQLLRDPGWIRRAVRQLVAGIESCTAK